MRALCLALFLAAPAAAEDYVLPAPPPGPHIDYSAERVDFDAERNMLHLSSGVVIKESTMTVKGEDLWIDTAQRLCHSKGPILIENGVSAAYGDSGEFDFVKHTGRLYHSSSGHGDWRIHARRAELKPNQRVEYRSANMTSCERVPPDYRFRATHVSVVPHKRFLAWNVLFYLGEVPVFYTPVFYHSLSPTHVLRWRMQPGLDGRNGPFLKNTLTTSHTDTIYSKLFVDYYSKQGIGHGAELNRNKGENSRGVLYGYRIQETSIWRSEARPNEPIVTSTNALRWAMLGDGYHALRLSKTDQSVLDSLQARLQVQSDADFNNHYARSSSLRVTEQLVNSGAYSHRFAQVLARVSYSRLDQVDWRRKVYLKTSESVPRLDANSVPLRIWRLPWLNTFSGFADNNYLRGRSYLEKSAGVGWEGTRNFLLGRGVSFTPKVAYSETYYNRFETISLPVYDAVIGRWNGAGTLRFNTPLGGLDTGYSYRQRFKHGVMQQDGGANDKGVEENMATASDVYILSPRAWARVYSGYDFRTFRSHTLGFRQRVQPIVAEASWQPTSKFAMTLRDDYQLQQGNRSFLADTRWGDDERSNVSVSVFHNLSTPEIYYGGLKFAVAPSSPTWRLTLGVNGLAVGHGGASGLRRGRIFDKQATWTQKWHDFYTKLAIRIRPGGVSEYAINVTLRFGVGNDKEIAQRNWEAEWFPERASGDADLRP